MYLYHAGFVSTFRYRREENGPKIQFVCLTALATGVQVCGIGTTCRSKCCGLLTHGITVP